jgi:hypothetical protein
MPATVLMMEKTMKSKSTQLKVLGAISAASEMMAWCLTNNIDVGDAYAIEEFILERSSFPEDGKNFAAAVQREAIALRSRLNTL